MKNIKEFTEEQFEAKYTAQINHIERALADPSVADEDICSFGGTMYETFGEDNAYVLEMAKENRVVSIIEGEDEVGEDGEDGEEHSTIYYVSGYHLVNLLVFGHLVVDKPLEEEFEIKLDY